MPGPNFTGSGTGSRSTEPAKLSRSASENPGPPLRMNLWKGGWWWWLTGLDVEGQEMERCRLEAELEIGGSLSTLRNFMLTI